MTGIWQRRALKFFLLIFIGLPCFTFGAYHLAYHQRIYPGITAAGQPVGNFTLSQATQAIEKKLPLAKTTQILLVADEQNWPLRLADLNLIYQATLSAQKAYTVGRSGHLFKDFQTKIHHWLSSQSLSLEYSWDQTKLEAQIATISSQLFIPAVEPTIRITKASSIQTAQVTIEQGKAGQELNSRQLLSLIKHQLAYLQFQPIKIPIIQISPTLTEKQIENSRQRAEKLLGKKLTLTHHQDHWTLNEEELVNFLSFTNGFNQEKVASWLANLAQTIDRPPQNAAFEFKNGRVVQFRTAREGQTLEQEKANQLINQVLVELEGGKNEARLKLPVTTTPPQITTAEVNTLGINELVGEGISYFRGSIASRIDNLSLASIKLNGLLIPPGETFSFNQSLGDVSQATGFKPAYIIKEGRTVLGDGGGVCQVSTTLFRTALNAGLPIIERLPHAYRVGYYEQNSSVGLDATVFDPTADLKFKNDTPAHLLIQSWVDKKNSKLTFSLYGTRDGRLVTLSQPRIWDQVSPPPDLYQDDPRLPAGTTKQIDWKAWGAKVAFNYKVTRGVEVLQDRTFYSHYRPWQAIFLRGTGN